MSGGSGDVSGGATGLAPGALTALLQEVAATHERREEEPLCLPPGTVVGRFEIIREMGRGGFGVVYEAKDRDLGRQVAVKVVRPGRIKEEEGKVSREAEAISRLAHPNLITLFEVGRSEHGPFLVFELLRGKTLDLRIEEGPLPVQEAVHLATEISRGLAHAHAEGVIHRDLKPANVFVTNKGQVKILDFGMAHAFGRRRLSGGTPAYMAPEQWEDAPEDERTDVFALGVLLYRMLTGEYPFPEGRGKWAAEPATVRRLDVPGAPELAELVEKMLDPTPTRRPRDGAAVLAALTPIEGRLRAKPADGSPPAHAKRRKATFGDLLAELRRRHVFRVMIGYGVFAFAVLQVTEPIMHGADLPNWVLKAVLVSLVLGFPVAVILAWVYDLTAQGVKRTPSATDPGAPRFGRSRLLLPLAVSAVVLTIGAAGAGAWYAWKRAGDLRPVAANAGVPSIAVLPFVDLSPNHDQEYLSDGIAEEILDGLARIEGLKVIGRTSSFSFKGRSEDLRTIGEKLGVNHLLEGSVRKVGARFRVSVKLVEARGGSNVWSETIEREPSDALALQTDVARAVATVLRVKLKLAPAAPKVNPDAYNQYLLGRQFARLGTQDGERRAFEAFRKAVQLDPTFAQAQAHLAGITGGHFALQTQHSLSGVLDLQERARAEADRAILLGPALPDGYLVRSSIRAYFYFDWAGALTDLEKARELGPETASFLAAESWLLGVMGKTTEAIARSERAVELEPLSAGLWEQLASLRIRAGQIEAARAAARRAEEIAPDSAGALWEAGLAELIAGNAGLAMEYFQRLPLRPGRLIGRALCLDRLERRGEADLALAELIQDHAHTNAFEIGAIHAFRGDRDSAFEWLDRSYRQHDGGITSIKGTPLLESLRGDPRYAALLRKMNLPADGEPAAPARATPVAPTPSIAVLPFADMSPKHDQEYFADGVAEEILNALAQVQGLKVIGRTSSFSFKGKSDDLKSIGQKLGVANVLEGSVRKEGSRIRITAKLIRVEDGAQLWSKVFDPGQPGVFAAQEEIARSVAEALRVALNPGGGAPRSGAPSNREAFDHYLLGRDLARSENPEDKARALAQFQKAVELDPGYAKAWAGIANELRWLEGVAVGGHQPARRERALEAAERAVALGGDLPDGYVARGRIRRGFLRDYGGALADLERARALGPSDAGASWALGQILLTFGRLPEAVAEHKRAVELDPLLARAWLLLGQAEISAGEHARAQASLARALEISPGGDEARYYLIADLLATGRPDAALAVATKAKMPWVQLPGVSMAQHDLGRPHESQVALEALIAGSATDAAFNVAEVHAWRGDADQAFAWLERARLQGDSGLPWIKADPLLRKIRGDPRWAPLLEKLNLPVD